MNHKEMEKFFDEWKAAHPDCNFIRPVEVATAYVTGETIYKRVYFDRHSLRPYSQIFGKILRKKGYIQWAKGTGRKHPSYYDPNAPAFLTQERVAELVMAAGREGTEK